jgi:two-component system, OmpR family, alkaline phosphatase synthesis response regulator PhoP
MTYKKKILLVEKDPEITALIKLQAELSGYKLQVEVDGRNGLRAIEQDKPDFVIIEADLSGQTGAKICQDVKSNPSLQHIPLIMISTRVQELDILLGLGIGADDYVPKPFSPRILFARLNALSRTIAYAKEKKDVPNAITFGDFTLEIDQYRLKKNNQTIGVTLSEFGILKRLLSNRGKVLTRNQLLDDIPNDEAFIVDRNIDVHVASIRKKLGPNFDWIDTVRGVGYRFKENFTPSTTKNEVYSN